MVCLSHRNAVYNLVGTKLLATVLSHYQLTPKTNRASLMGSMNFSRPEGSAVAYASSILGNNLPVAAGIAMNRALSKTTSVVFVFTGDGAMEEGSFWETILFARSHQLPLVIVVENNDYSMSSTIAQRRSNIDLSKVCEGVGIRTSALAARSSTKPNKHFCQRGPKLLPEIRPASSSTWRHSTSMPVLLPDGRRTV